MKGKNFYALKGLVVSGFGERKEKESCGGGGEIKTQGKGWIVYN